MSRCLLQPIRLPERSFDRALPADMQKTREPFGLSVAEALLCGTPVIAFNRGSMPELIVPGETGFLPADVGEVIPLLDKLPTISRKRCTQWARDNFSQDRMVDQYIEVYKKVLAR